jgi:hypothetical protein
MSKKWLTLRNVRRWEEVCNCSGVSLCGYIPTFIHAKTCPLYECGVQNWAELISAQGVGSNVQESN